MIGRIGDGEEERRKPAGGRDREKLLRLLVRGGVPGEHGDIPAAGDTDRYPLLDRPDFRREIRDYVRRFRPHNDVPSLCDDAHYEIFSRHLLSLGARRVVDIGCANGTQSLFFRETGVDYIGIDAYRPTGDPAGLPRRDEAAADIPFFGEGRPGLRYIEGWFPFGENTRVPADAAICNLSIGFDPEAVQRRYPEIASAMAALYPRIYLYSTPSFLGFLQGHYRIESVLEPERLRGFTPLLVLAAR